MNYTEAVTLVALVKSACPAQKFEEMTATVWQGILEDVSYGDAAASVKVLGRRLRFIAPSDIIEQARILRRERLSRADALFQPPKGLEGETEAEYAARYQKSLREHLKAVGDGVPDPVMPELTRVVNVPALQNVFPSPSRAVTSRLPAQRVETSPRVKALMRARLERSA